MMESGRITVEFDNGAAWLPGLAAHLGNILPQYVGETIAGTQPAGPNDASIALYELVDKHALIEGVRAWITDQDVLVYHGTRINEAQRSSILREGLKLMSTADRIPAIEAFLGDHPRWPEIAHRVPEAIAFVGRSGGVREGMVFALLSRSGLVRGCNHYLVEGSEFDHHVANYLLDSEICHEQNRRRGIGSLVQIRLRGEAALRAANPHGELGDQPNLIGELIEALAWWLATGDSDTEAFEEGAALVFHDPIPPLQITAIIQVSDEELWEHYDNRMR
jgi:hypothetical protein